ncbi:hypothetical protein JB92DRAFT_3125320 [Gautieria morchelliformis]|nr:hypothetical protein JB92DRAFT_3125320 [Gautieria morchelliformis]
MLSLRLNASVPCSTDLASLCAQLNWCGNTPFITLSGAFPVPPSPPAVDKYSFDYSHPASLPKDKSSVPFAQRDVYRGLDTREKAAVQSWVVDAQSELQEPFLTRYYINIPYPIPSSHPQFFTNLDVTSEGILSPTSTCVRSLPTYTSLRTTLRTGVLARSYARLVENIWKRAVGIVEEVGIEWDVLTDIEKQFWVWDGVYGEEDDRDEVWGEGSTSTPTRVRAPPYLSKKLLAEKTTDVVEATSKSRSTPMQDISVPMILICLLQGRYPLAPSLPIL